MSNQNNQNSRKRVLVLLWLILILFLLLTAATYTWFSLSKTPGVSDMAIYVNANKGLELSWTALGDEWGQHLSFGDVEKETAGLKPVTYSHAEDAFYAANFGVDGRISGITYRLTDEVNANNSGSDGYYIKTTFFARTGESVKVSLMPAAQNPDKKDGTGTYLIGTPLWNTDELIHDNGGSGAEYAIRIGLRITKTTLTGKPLEGEDPLIYIYEPNCDRHIDGSEGYVITESINGTALVPDECLIRQTSSSWSEADPVQRTTVLYELGEFLRDPYIFSLSPDNLARIDMYIWLEGQDVDCVNQIGQEARILSNIQFWAEAEGQSGLQPIE